MPNKRLTLRLAGPTGPCPVVSMEERPVPPYGAVPQHAPGMPAACPQHTPSTPPACPQQRRAPFPAWEEKRPRRVDHEKVEPGASAPGGDKPA